MLLENTFYEYGYLNSAAICFMAQCMVNLHVYSICVWEECVFSNGAVFYKHSFYEAC